MNVTLVPLSSVQIMMLAIMSIKGRAGSNKRPNIK